MKIIGVGDNKVDVYLHQNKMYPGGKSVNVPVLALRAGAEKAGYIGLIGDDRAGRLLRAGLEEEGLDLSRLRVIHGSNSKNAIILDKSNDRTWAGNNRGGDCAGLQLQFTQADLDCIAGYDVLHTSVHSEIPYLLPLVHGKVLISMDFSDGYTDERIDTLCPYLDVAFFSSSGLTKEKMEAVLLRMLEAGAKLVVCTMGMDGSLVSNGRERIFQPAVKSTEPIVDTLGAGDTYTAAFLLEYWNSRDMQRAAMKGAQFALTTLRYYGAFGHGVEADSADLILNR